MDEVQAVYIRRDSIAKSRSVTSQSEVIVYNKDKINNIKMYKFHLFQEGKQEENVLVSQIDVVCYWSTRFRTEEYTKKKILVQIAKL